MFLDKIRINYRALLQFFNYYIFIKVYYIFTLIFHNKNINLFVQWYLGVRCPKYLYKLVLIRFHLKSEFFPQNRSQRRQLVNVLMFSHDFPQLPQNDFLYHTTISYGQRMHCHCSHHVHHTCVCVGHQKAESLLS